ncbi:ASCH domain-containing protein [Mucilaginibacter sp. 14171R-50]|uniref:ASCH domain-containing protein n=1 Tax=Mucilaginibacter sp. 14171R-50 TaxID=2703789 RepID=UPI00138C387A|nr:ASCH domain-containing protein [Mucilaginibacter sp. 14171R-50]QHS55370.1 ASCH domain-containing protein [Mucilaginibacter sp. 14171R-50]
MKVVLSIKPEFAFKIFNGTKRFEFRKAIFKNPLVKQVIVYASSPVQRVIGEFEIEEILKCDKKLLWELTKQESGITEDFFFQYFKEKKDGYAIRIKNTTTYENSRCLKEDYNLLPPQSFAYYI